MMKNVFKFLLLASIATAAAYGQPYLNSKFNYAEPIADDEWPRWTGADGILEGLTNAEARTALDLTALVSGSFTQDIDMAGFELQSTGGADMDFHSDNKVIFRAGDSAGVDRFEFYDSLGNLVAYITSDGQFNNAFAGGGGDGAEVHTQAFVRGVSNAGIWVSGGSDESNGATMLLYGEAVGGGNNDRIEFRTDATVIGSYSGSDLTTWNFKGTQSLDDGDLLDLSSVVHNDTARQGLHLPQLDATPSSPATGEGYISWDPAANVIKVFDGTSWTTVSGGGAFDIDALSEGADTDITVNDRFVLSDDGTEKKYAPLEIEQWIESLDLDLASLSVTTLDADEFLFTDQNASPNTAGELLYDNTITGLDDGGLVWYDDDEIQTIVSLDSSEVLDATDDGHLVRFVWNGGLGRFDLVADGAGGETNDLETQDPPNVLDDEVYIGTGAGAGNWVAVPDSDGATQKLQYDAATGAFSAGTDDDQPEAGDFAAAADLDLNGEIVLDDDGNPTTDGQLSWDTTAEVLEVGDDGAATYRFVPAASFSGDATMTDAGVVTVGDDSHSHVITNIDAFTEAQLQTQLSNVTDVFTNNDGALDDDDVTDDPIGSLSNVVLTSPTSGQVLEYNGSNWVNATDDTGGGGANLFETINAPSGTDPVADSTTDTLNLTAGQDIVITGTAATDTIDIAFDGDLTGGTTLGGAAIQTGAEDDQPEAGEFGNAADLDAQGEVVLDDDGNPTTDGQLSWDTTAEVLEVGDDGAATYRFVPAASFSGDATVTDAGVVTVADASHAHNVGDISTFSSADLRGRMNDESGTGAALFAGGAIGAATATTPAADDNDTSVATTAFVQGEIGRDDINLIDVTGSFASPITTNPYDLNTADCWGGTVFYGATGEIDLDAGVTGQNVIIYNTGAFTITIDPDATDDIIREGTDQADGVSITLSSGAGNYVALLFDGASWITLGYKGTLAAGS